LSYGIQTGKGMLLVTGGNGCGKTLLSRRLIVGFSPARYDVAFMRIGQQELCRGNSAIEPVDVGPCASGLLTAEEPTSYITVHMAAATEWTGLFIKEAMAVMYEQGRRIVRLLNAHCDQRLSAGAIEHDLQLDERLVQRVGTVI
jgi:type II secretory pathway predicted ATPase ExeA